MSRIGRPPVPFCCRVCGEWRSAKFSAGYKTLCSFCRADVERNRVAALTGKPNNGPRKPAPKKRPAKPAAKPKATASWLDILMPDRR